MSDLFDEAKPGSNAPEFSVAEISGAVKKTLEGAFSRVRVRGEVGRVVIARSGHLYFDLKDDRAVISGVAWKGSVSRLTTQPEEGMEVVATGRISTFGGQSKYQLIVDDVEMAGQGALLAMLEKRRKALEAEGLFAPSAKRPIPYLPRTIGVITSPSGAVIRDILHRLRERFPTPVYLWPVAVQGKTSAAEVANAIAGFDSLEPGGAIPRPDLLIVARGGGSIEDLWGFNEEIVVRAVAACSIPVISAVGHETDTTLIDFAADLRAPTPTAAAERAVPVRVDLLAALSDLDARRQRAVSRGFEARRTRLGDLSRLLPRPQALVEERRQRLDLVGDGLPKALISNVAQKRARLSEAGGKLSLGRLGEQVTKRRGDLVLMNGRLSFALGRNSREARLRLGSLAKGLTLEPTRREMARQNGVLAERSERLIQILPKGLARLRERLTSADRMRQTLGYRETLKRGYAVLRDEAGQVLPDKARAEAAGGLEIEFRDGRLAVAQNGVAPKSPAKAAPKPPSKAPKKSDDQGSLF